MATRWRPRFAGSRALVGDGGLGRFHRLQTDWPGDRISLEHLEALPVWLDGVVDLPSLPYCTILDGALVWVVFLTPVITVRPLLAGPCNTESSVLQGVETGEDGSG